MTEMSHYLPYSGQRQTLRCCGTRTTRFFSGQGALSHTAQLGKACSLLLRIIGNGVLRRGGHDSVRPLYESVLFCYLFVCTFSWDIYEGIMMYGLYISETFLSSSERGWRRPSISLVRLISHVRVWMGGSRRGGDLDHLARNETIVVK